MLNSHRIFKRLAKALTSLCVCAGWSEPLRVAHTNIVGNLMSRLMQRDFIASVRNGVMFSQQQFYIFEKSDFILFCLYSKAFFSVKEIR